MNRSTLTIGILEKCGIPLSASVLDAGCGNGETLKLLKERGYTHLFGLDTDPIHVAHTKSVVDIPVVETDILSASFADSFDVILLLDVLEHVTRGTEQLVLDKLCSMLSKNGVLIISVPYRGWAALFDPANLKKVFTANTTAPWHRHYSFRRIRTYLVGHPLVAYERRGIGLSQLARLVTAPLRRIPSLRSPILSKIARIGGYDYSLSAGPFSYHLMVAIRK
ncbi:MAG TPA: class I SAM-dependent methyltransferase [Candidatus Paceibacterota bacterium]|jgi:SAM-dependent methyltransferase|nr:class I SAM-dependent methyltransferase [Candidatus Paceibacterota bacterium]